MLELINELFPICRSIAGPGLRQTLQRIQRRVPIEIHEVPTGTQAFDWTVPQEWTLRRATLRDPSGKLIADTDVNNLHVLNFSTPFSGKLALEQLRPHLHSMADKPKWIPYRTSYYKPVWGICLPHEAAAALPEGEYDANIDTTIADGSLSYGELFIPGKSKDEVFFSTHCCHPSLANDNLSGIAVAIELAKWLASRDNVLSYRFVFIPGTIGSITWLSQNAHKTSRIVAGLVLSCLGDGGAFTYKRSRQESSLADQAVTRALIQSGEKHSIRDFVPYGYDERQYCSPGFDLPVGCLMRTPNGEYAEYHTSADDTSFVREDALRGSVEMLKSIVWQIELAAGRPAVRGSVDRGDGHRYMNLNPHCEPQLGRRGLYAMMGGKASVPDLQMALLWVLNYSDGQHGVDWIARRSKIDPKTIDAAVTLLSRANLLSTLTA